MLITCMLFPGVDGESFSAGDDSFQDPVLRDDEGNNLMDSRPSVVIQEPVLLDLPRDPVDKGLFESYTDTGTLFRTLTDTDFLSLSPPSQFLEIFLSLSIFPGISSPLLRFRPFSLFPGSRYMLQITASKFHNHKLTFLPKCNVHRDRSRVFLCVLTFASVLLHLYLLFRVKSNNSIFYCYNCLVKVMHNNRCLFFWIGDHSGV